MHKLILRNLEEILYRMVIVPMVAFFPAPLAYRLACLRGDWSYRLAKLKREQIIRSLEEFYGDQLSPVERSELVRDFFRRRSCQALDVMRLAGRGRALARLIEIRGLQHVEAALAGGKGAVLFTAHFGSFNAGLSLLGAHGFPITVVGSWKSTYDSSMSPVKRFFRRLLIEKQAARHRRPNIEPLKEPLGSAIRIAEALRSNELVAIPLDAPTPASATQRAVVVDFLGRHMLLLPGSIELAQLMGSPVMLLLIRRSHDWRHQVLEISPPVPLDGDAVTAFKRCVKMLEAPIRQNPAHWDWWGNRENLVDLGLLPAQEQL